jgi:hypothetical protein
VGQIILNFSSIENALGMAYSMSNRAGPKAGGEAFYTNTNFKTKLRMVDQHMRASLSGAKLKTWARIHSRVVGVSKARNHMAHLVLVNHVANRVMTPMLQPAWFSPKKKDVKTYALRDVEEWAKEIDEARLELWEFVRGVAFS